MTTEADTPSPAVRVGAAVDELGLAVGDEAICVVKATNVIVEVPG